MAGQHAQSDGGSTTSGTGGTPAEDSGGKTGEAGIAGEPSGGQSGDGSNGGSGVSAGAGGFTAGTGGAGGSGGTSECSTAADCVTAYGTRGCGVWECSAGTCEIGWRCEDLDHDGFGVGVDCECGGKELDCDDGDPGVGDTASTSCCDGGTRSCTGGSWGTCSTRGGETCNGEDDDCDGIVDNLPEVSCGLGACRITVPSCTGNKPSACIPPAPATTVDGCNGIDDDCDGAIDEDCAKCVHVAPDGDDGLATSSDGATPFASVQAAIDFTDTHRALAHQVCVAAGAECGAQATYSGPSSTDLTMRDGISVLGNYESTTWTRCSNSVTTLAPQTTAGVVFPENIVLTTALDGFTVLFGPSASPATGVSVNGARGALLTNLIVTGPTIPYPTLAAGDGIGVDVSHGAIATIARSAISGHASNGYTAAVRSVGSRVFIEDNCADQFEASTGRCTGPCSIHGVQAIGANEDAIVLTDSPGSRVERSSVCSNNSSGSGGSPLAMSVVRVSGASAGIVLRGNTLKANSVADDPPPSPMPERDVLSFKECGGAAPWVVDNDAITLSAWSDADGILAVGDCHPVIENNVTVGVTQISPMNTRGIQCRAGSVPSRCTIVGNDFRGTGHATYGIHGGVIGFSQSTTTRYKFTVMPTSAGILCQGMSCQAIAGNYVIGTDYNANCASNCALTSTGVSLDHADIDVTGNAIDSGSQPNAQRFYPASISGTTLGSVTGNQLAGPAALLASLFENNTCSGGVSWGDGGIVRNNCLKGTGSPPPFSDQGADHGPQEFTNNHLVVSGGATLYAHGSNTLTSIEQVNALTDVVSSGNDTTNCP